MSAIGSYGSQRGKVWPTTAAGQWSTAPFTFMLLGGIGIFGAALSGESGGEGTFDNLRLGIPSLVGLTGAIISMITGLFAVLKRHERTSAVILTATVSTEVLLYVALIVALG